MINAQRVIMFLFVVMQADGILEIRANIMTVTGMTVTVHNTRNRFADENIANRNDYAIRPPFPLPRLTCFPYIIVITSGNQPDSERNFAIFLSTLYDLNAMTSNLNFIEAEVTKCRVADSRLQDTTRRRLDLN